MKISDFREILKFCENFDFSKKIGFSRNFRNFADFCENFEFRENIEFWRKYRFFEKNWIFPKISDFQKNFGFRRKF